MANAIRRPATPNRADLVAVPQPIVAKDPRIGPAQHTAHAAAPIPTTGGAVSLASTPPPRTTTR